MTARAIFVLCSSGTCSAEVQSAAQRSCLSAQGEIPEGKLPYFRLPIFNYHEGYLSTSYTATYYELAQRHAEVPRLTNLQREAIRYFNALARVSKPQPCTSSYA